MTICRTATRDKANKKTNQKNYRKRIWETKPPPHIFFPKRKNFFSFLTDKQKERAIHLVAVHDKKFELKDVDELVLMEADMLSSLDVNTKKPILNATSNKQFMDSMVNIRIPKFITEFSKNEAKRLIQAREEYFKQR